MVRYLTMEEMQLVAHSLAQEMMSWNEPIPPFNTRFPHKLESCLSSVSATFGGKDLYPTLDDKAAALLYLLVKNHPFQNGNKRIAVTGLLVFLMLNGYWMSVDTVKLYNFAVWVARSDPELNEETIAAAASFVRKNKKRVGVK